RFLLHVGVDYPDRAAELDILRLVRGEQRQTTSAAAPVRLTEADVLAAQLRLSQLHMAEPVERYLVELVMATRDTESNGPIAYGASPRGTLALDRCARAEAWLNGRDFVTPEDVQAVAGDCLRHRILLTFEAEAEGTTVDDLIGDLLRRVPTP
ncbi:MAG: MoxR family ATPase, partial [Pseudomonadota bacterium]